MMARVISGKDVDQSAETYTGTSLDAPTASLASATAFTGRLFGAVSSCAKACARVALAANIIRRVLRSQTNYSLLEFYL
jgi:hypothetical protein